MPNMIVADQRILRGVAATLTVTMTDFNGSPAAAAGAVTVAVTRGDATIVLNAGTATSNPSTGVYTVALTAAQTATLDLLTAVWTDAGDGSTITTIVEVAGGFYFNLAEARAALQNPAAHGDSAILERRRQVEDECEWICDVAFVPRYRRISLDGTGDAELDLVDNQLRTIRSLRVYSDATTYTALTASQLAAVKLSDNLRIRRTDGATFDEGVANIVVEYEHGYERPPVPLKDAALERLRDLLSRKAGAQLSERSTSVTTPAGNRFDLAQQGPYSTGLPRVDAVYHRYSERGQGGNDGSIGAASRAFDLDPQRSSLFHGGRR